MEVNFPLAVQIVDFRHAGEHLRALHCSDPGQWDAF
jgi:hypothetical protein